MLFQLIQIFNLKRKLSVKKLQRNSVSQTSVVTVKGIQKTMVKDLQ